MFSVIRNKRSEANEHSDVDITPMLDVVFILLIFFIVTASFIKESGFAVNKPEALESSETPERSIVLDINANDEIRIQNRLVQLIAVESTLVRLLAESPNAQVSVRLHPNTTTKAMVGAIDSIRSANIPSPPVSLSKT